MKRVLVANRGEIALRIIRACHEEGLEAVAVYSEADRLAAHVRAADAAAAIGPAPAAESYLRIDRLLDAARTSGADAVHPGYGFLAERPDFAEAVTAAGLTFVGPPASAIAAMGDKAEARRRMQAAGVPVVPGAMAVAADAADGLRMAGDVGFPVLLKAAAGGGGRGMRVVHRAAEFGAAYQAAESEAAKAFGDGRLYVERLLERPRHVEIQVLGDREGRVAHLGERECSIQRRHQKLIEESPSPVVDVGLRRAMGDAAVRAAEAVGYVNAGTCEFLLLPSGEFYFLEMNTRLQVEHPVTELVYGIDIVRQQLRIAAGQALTLPKRAMTPRGWAIECRITCEDPFADFLPAAGEVTYLRVPGGPGVRWDGWIEPGTMVPLAYDSLLGKLIAWAGTRERAIARARRALGELVIVGLPTSREFHLRVMTDPAFQRGDLDIEYWERVGRTLMARAAPDHAVEAAAVTAALLSEEGRGAPSPPPPPPPPSLRGPGPLARPRAAAEGGPPASPEPSSWAEAARREGLR